MGAAARRRQRLPQRLHLRAIGENEIDLCRLDVGGDGGMMGGPARPHLQHVAQHGDAPARFGAAPSSASAAAIEAGLAL